MGEEQSGGDSLDVIINSLTIFPDLKGRNCVLHLTETVWYRREFGDKEK